MRATVILSALIAALAVSALPTVTVDERAVAQPPAEGDLAPRDDHVLDAKKKRLAGRIVAYGEPAPRQVNPPQHEQDPRHFDWHHPKPPPKPSSKWPHWKRDDDDIDAKTGRKKPKPSKKPKKP
ncbi:uncharacterized protein LOC62_03G005189 [Vanrija pseudolonga]|uniref:Uncharacterized protein n=1 Tax=Vanrija pseudolonga TaxID=143232 RepID=A0AAF0YBI2_9TREE|nr:hypothetical protein LOC62_03G005189 [Vanrija pseudolonga]